MIVDMSKEVLDYLAKELLNQGCAEGEYNKLISLVQKKLAKNQQKKFS